VARALGRRRLQREITLTVAARGPIRQSILDELQSILEAAESGGGAERGGPMLTSLKTAMQDPTVTPNHPPDPRGTYGMSGASYFPGVETVGVQGSGGFIGSVQGLKPGARALGARAVGLHDEMHHITELPGVQAVLSTQNNCLFCYGVLHARNYQHGPIRDKPWPQAWRYGDFKLEETSARLDAITTDPIVKIETSLWGTHYYVVTDLRG
jgi:hypothetical protein